MELKDLSLDEQMMLKQIAASVIKDGITAEMLEGNEAFQVETMFAYMDSEIKKFDKFAMKVHTNPEALNVFSMKVLSIM